MNVFVVDVVGTNGSRTGSGHHPFLHSHKSKKKKSSQRSLLKLFSHDDHLKGDEKVSVRFQSEKREGEIKYARLHSSGVPLFNGHQVVADNQNIFRTPKKIGDALPEGSSV